MKNLLLILAVITSGLDAFAATRNAPAKTAPSVPTSMTGARAARTPTNVRSTTNTTSATKSVSARGTTPATKSQATTSNAVRGRAATTPTTAARAASKQSVISNGTKVAAAAQNTAVDEVCWGKFSGCMDSFCMLDNANGGRCICSDKNAEFDEILAEIQELDAQSYQMATVGVERLEMGEDADAVMAKTESVTKKISTDSTKSKRQSLDLSSWNTINVDFDADVEDIFSLSSDGNSITNKTGDALYRASAKLCNAQIPECASQSNLMELMYAQRIRSDCAAYENSLRQQRTQSAQKLASAQSAMREAALEQYRAANKYDLGQCTVEFKKCMQTTGGCGDDFTGCVTQQTTRDTLLSEATDSKTKAPKQKKIKGASTTIEIAAWTYDALESKKPLCMTVTQQCVNVRDQVWDTFLREVAPTVKSAELAAESNLRTSCISTISNCFQKACKDNMDSNDPEGSYDMCLTRPETLSKLCKIEIDPCEAAVPEIMEYVKARLASMRVDSCTREFKSCLQSEDRCGEDYTQCVGLDTDSIVQICPREKLVGCYDSDKAEQDVYDNLAEIAQGIFLNIDNNMLTTCQKAVNSAMLKVCGSTTDCDDLIVDENIGTRSLEYKMCTIDENGNLTNNCRGSLDAFTKAEVRDNRFAGMLSGTIYWGEISYNPKNSSATQEYEFTPMENYMAAIANSMGYESPEKLSLDQRNIISEYIYRKELKPLTTSVEQAIKAIESDQTVQYCMTGRKVQGYNGHDFGSDTGRFPNLTNQMRQTIAMSVLQTARDNYMKKYDEMVETMMRDQVSAAQTINEETAKITAATACRNLALNSTLPESKAPVIKNTDEIVGGIITMIGSVLLAAPTGGASLLALGVGLGMVIDGSTNNSSTIENSTPNFNITDYIGMSEINQWNYKERIVTTPNYETGVCVKVRTTQKCAKTKDDYCDQWDEPIETTETINLLN